MSDSAWATQKKTASAEPNYWVFANKSEGTYGHRIWDMSWILENNRYTLKKSERKRWQVKVGDVVYLRIYGQGYIGKFVIGGEWEPCPELDVNELPPSDPPGTFAMNDIVLWNRLARQDLVIRDLSNGDVRSRVVEITRADGEMIEEVQQTQRPPSSTARHGSRPHPPVDVGVPSGSVRKEPSRQTPELAMRAFLDGLPSNQTQVSLTFAQMGAIRGRDLPPPARGNPSWWSNRQDVSHAAQWLGAGWRCDRVYLKAQIVVFRRRQDDPIRQIPQYVAHLMEGSSSMGSPGIKTICRWIRLCRQIGWYFEGVTLYERGGPDPAALTDAEAAEVEEDYHTSKRELTRHQMTGLDQ